MPEAPDLWIEVQAVEHVVDPTSGAHRMRVRFECGTDDGLLCEWAIWIPHEQSLDRAVDLARKELHRVSSLLARNGRGVDSEQGSPRVEHSPRPRG